MGYYTNFTIKLSDKSNIDIIVKRLREISGYD